MNEFISRPIVRRLDIPPSDLLMLPLEFAAYFLTPI